MHVPEYLFENNMASVGRMKFYRSINSIWKGHSIYWIMLIYEKICMKENVK